MQLITGGGTVAAAVKAPASKSYAQRAVAAALLGRGRSVITNVDPSNDTSAALSVAARLGAAVTDEGGGRYSIEGGMRPVADTIDIGESGLSARMFTPIAALLSVPVTIAGHGSIMARPLGMMIEPLRRLGVDVSSRGGFLPITVRGPLGGGEAEVDGSASSQFLTGLLMALPLAAGDSTLHVADLASRPYIDMTLDVLRAFGVEVSHDCYRTFRIPGGQSYRPAVYGVEGDWSGASCLLVAGAVAGNVEVFGLSGSSAQADRAIVDALRMAGARVEMRADSVACGRGPLRAFEFDATQCPDLFPALAALAACCEGTSAIRGTGRLRHKESDRAATIASEMGRAGVAVDLSQADVMKITGGPVRGARVSSHNDHRIAMAMAVLGLVCSGTMEIEGGRAVDKSYPGFWGDLRNIYNR